MNTDCNPMDSETPDTHGFVENSERPFFTGWEDLEDDFLADEKTLVAGLLDASALDPALRERARVRALRWVKTVRSRKSHFRLGIEDLLTEYDLSTEEGIVLMCLAEALIRIPDAATVDRLIQDKIGSARWSQHVGANGSWLVNAASWGLLLTGALVRFEDHSEPGAWNTLRAWVGRVGEPVVRSALLRAMKMMGSQFVMGITIDAALAKAAPLRDGRHRFSFDMLGEAALTPADADHYWDAYAQAIDAVGHARGSAVGIETDTVSIKLSALHPRFEFAQSDQVLPDLCSRVTRLAERARDAGIGITIDAEEAHRLELGLAVFENVYRARSLRDYPVLGLAVQAYGKRVGRIIDGLADLSHREGKQIPVRLVKGAYWDSEIKWAQQEGLAGYPVLTRKAFTDLSYLAAARRLFAADHLYPQFATHNALTLAMLIELSGGQQAFECQRLFGMGESLYQAACEDPDFGQPCRIYAPCGAHRELLPYLVRRLLENGANTSFVHRIADPRVPAEEIVADPVEQVLATGGAPHPGIALPRAIYLPERLNSRGLNRASRREWRELKEEMLAAVAHPMRVAQPRIGGEAHPGRKRILFNPADRREAVGIVYEAESELVDRAVSLARAAQPAWNRLRGCARAEILERAADQLETERGVLAALVVREGGKTVPDALGEVREAADALRYYASRTRADFEGPILLPGPAGERNELWLEGRGVFACISPWNFPLAIFTAQIGGALAAGNAVIAKPAEQTPLVASEAIRILHASGVPGDVLGFLPGDGPSIGAVLTAHPGLAGVAFTGSTETAWMIQKALSTRGGALPVLIAETGGVNAMIVDSTALPEQVVADVVQSAFLSAGQRCSALRILCLQEEIADRVLTMLAGHLATLTLGDPGWISTDIGPVIDEEARTRLAHHRDSIQSVGRLIYEMPLPEACAQGTFFAPCMIELDAVGDLPGEVFGPILHVVRFPSDRLHQLIRDINETGYGLTFGIHSRIDQGMREMFRETRCGNTYVNRNMVGAVMGVQPFGGQGLSGTGPKAGGPHYLNRFAVERVLTINTAAVGGNATLLNLSEASAPKTS
ncbi:MAG: bifunctional proline dehydrogenase/L-glutamate gamma-semialdehyde dehydrogenase PutA [Gammaproteobacteria bacterium]